MTGRELVKNLHVHGMSVSDIITMTELSHGTVLECIGQGNRLFGKNDDLGYDIELNGRMVVNRMYYRDYSLSEIAEMTGYTYRTVTTYANARYTPLQGKSDKTKSLLPKNVLAEWDEVRVKLLGSRGKEPEKLVIEDEQKRSWDEIAEDWDATCQFLLTHGR